MADGALNSVEAAAATLVVSFANCKRGDRTLRSNDVALTVIIQTYGDLLGEI
jgi:hypothetical protein